MKAEQYMFMIREAVAEEILGDSRKIDLLSKNLQMLDEAKQELRSRGYGWIGLDILQTAKEVPMNSRGSSSAVERGSPLSSRWFESILPLLPQFDRRAWQTNPSAVKRPVTVFSAPVSISRKEQDMSLLDYLGFLWWLATHPRSYTNRAYYSSHDGQEVTQNT